MKYYDTLQSVLRRLAEVDAEIARVEQLRQEQADLTELALSYMGEGKVYFAKSDGYLIEPDIAYFRQAGVLRRADASAAADVQVAYPGVIAADAATGSEESEAA